MGYTLLKEAKILYLDIETAPSLGYVWGKWEQDVMDFEEQGYLLSYAWKWHGDKSVSVNSLRRYKNYKKDKTNDKELVQGLWNLIDEADVVIAHNGDRFDLPYAYSRFITHGMRPPSPVRTVDTLKIARNKFRFVSNKLDDIGRDLQLGRKVPHTGFKLWKGCMEGDAASWILMEKYNKHDVELLEAVYLAFRGWTKTHPNIATIEEKLCACPVCTSTKLQKRGLESTTLGKKQRYQCTSCGKWSYGPVIKIEGMEIR